MDGYISGVQRREKYAFKRFSPKVIKPGSIVVALGKKGSGKTTAIMDVAYALRHHPEVTLMQKTYDTNPAFHGIVPGLFCYTEWRPDVVRTIIDRQKKENKKRQREGKPFRYHLLILDDLAGNEAFCKDKLLQELMFNARWYKITIVFTMQYSLKMSPDLRSQFDWVIMCRENMRGNRKRLYEHYCGQFDTQQEFDHVFTNMTKNYGCMVLNNGSISNDLTETFYHFRARNRNFNECPKAGIKKWRIGSKAYWVFNNRFFDPHWDSSDDDDEVNSGEFVIDRLEPASKRRR